MMGHYMSLEKDYGARWKIDLVKRLGIILLGLDFTCDPHNEMENHEITEELLDSNQKNGFGFSTTWR